MKKALRVALVLLAALFLTGCYKMNMEMSIGDDKTVDFVMIYAIDKENMDTLNEYSEDGESSSITVDDFKELKEKGYKVEEYSEKTDEYDYQGVKISKTFNNIDDLVSEDGIATDVLVDDEDINTKWFTKNGSKYKSIMNFDFSSEEEDEDETISNDELDKMLDLKYTVTLPRESISNNADEVSNDGKTLTWNLKYGVDNKVDYEFELKLIKEPKKFNDSEDDEKIKLSVYIAAGVGIVFILGVVTALATKKK